MSWATGQASARNGSAVLIQLKGRLARQSSPSILSLPAPGRHGHEIERQAVREVLERHAANREAAVEPAIVAIDADLGDCDIGNQRDHSEGEEAQPDGAVI